MIKSQEVSNFRAKFSFFFTFTCGCNKKIAKAKLMEKAYADYSELIAKTNVEIEEMLLAILNKPQEGDLSPKLKFIEELNIQLLNFPRLPGDVSELVEIEEVIQARVEHHEKIKTAVDNYLTSGIYEPLEANVHISPDLDKI